MTDPRPQTVLANDPFALMAAGVRAGVGFRAMNSRRPGLASRTRDRRAEYNRWAGRHTLLIWAIVAVLLAILLILIAARLSHPLPPLPSGSTSPHTDQGRLS